MCVCVCERAHDRLRQYLPVKATENPEREFFIDNLQVRIHLIIEMILADRPCAMGA